MKKRLLAMFLCIVMCVSLLPLSALAEDGEDGAAIVLTEEEQTETTEILPEEETVLPEAVEEEPEIEVAQVQPEVSEPGSEEEPVAEADGKEPAAEAGQITADLKASEEKETVIKPDAEKKAEISGTKAIDDYPELVLNEEATATISNPGDSAWFKFTPNESGFYSFCSGSTNNDTESFLYDSGMNQLAYDDDTGPSWDFRLEQYLTAGNTYIFEAKYRNDDIGSFEVFITDKYFHAYAEDTWDNSYRIEAEAGLSYLLHVEAVSSYGDISYQWYDSEETAIEGATEPDYLAGPLVENTQYRCYVTDEYGNDTSVVFYLHIDVENGFYAYDELTGDRWTSRYVNPNSTLTLRVSAGTDSGSDTIYYQWYKTERVYDEEDPTNSWLSNVEIPGATTAELTTDLVTEYTQYECYVRDDWGNYGWVTYEIYIENDLYAYVYGTEDNSAYLEVEPNATPTLRVSASTGTGSISYQWYKVVKIYDEDDPMYWREYSEAIPGATTDKCTAEAITEYIRYECEVRDDFGNNQWVYFDIFVNNGFFALANNTDTNSAEVLVAYDQITTLRVNAGANTGSISYQWYKVVTKYDEEDPTYSWEDRVLISGATEAAFETGPITESIQYRCYVIDDYGNNAWVYFHVSVDNGFYAYADGTNTEYAEVRVPYEQKTTLRVNAGANTGSIAYQWYCSGDIMDGETGSVLDIASVTEYNYYECHVTDDYGGEKWIWFSVYVDTGFYAYIDDPETTYAEVFVEYGKPITLHVTAGLGEGVDGSISYQWVSYSSSIGEATDPDLTIESVTSAGTYYCYVFDGFGNNARLTFVVGVKTGLYAYANDTASNYDVVYVTYGKTTKLHVNAGADKNYTGGFSYTWSYSNQYGYHEIDNATGPNITTEAITGYYYYTCVVTDDFGNEKNVSFSVNVDNGLKACVKGTANDYAQYIVPLNESQKLEIQVSARETDGLRYTWYKIDPRSYSRTNVTPDTDTSLTASNVDAYTIYQAVVTDKYGTSVYVHFYLYVENHLEVYANDSGYSSINLMFPANASTTLYVSVEADNMENITYQWLMGYKEPTGQNYLLRSENAYYYPISGEVESTLELSNLNGTHYYACKVTDCYGMSSYALFTVTATDHNYKISEYHLQIPCGKNQTLKVTENGKDVSAKWSSTNPTIAAVSSKGVVTAKQVGYSTITATVGDVELKCFVEVQFKDVTDGSRSFYNPVYWAFQNGITTGTSATTFSPNNSCTRAQIVTFLWRLKGCPEPSSLKSPFTDVTNPNASYYKAVLWALENGITTGTSATTFSPSKACTRAQCVTFLWRALGCPEPESEENPFKDVTNPKASYYKAVLWAVENGITTGTSKSTFSPDKTCTRGQIVTFLYRYNFL